MPELVRFELEDGSPVLFETADGGVVRVRSGEADAVDGGRLRERLAGAAHAAQAVSTALRDKVSPDELTLELGLKLSGQANWFVARSHAEGSVKVTLKWKSPPAGPEAVSAETEPAETGAAETESEPLPDPEATG